MFWKYNSPSSAQLEALLAKEDVTLLQLMGEDELLQECKSQNKKVIEFLTKPEILKELVQMIVTEPPVITDVNVQFKNASLASELLTCDVMSITTKLSSSTDLLQYLYEFLQNEKPLNPLLASFVSKVLGMLVLRKSEQNWYSYRLNCFQVIDFLKSKEDFVCVVVNHVGTSAVLDLLSKLMDGVDDDDKELKVRIHEWLDEKQLIQKLVDKLSPECDSSEHASVDQILCEIASTKWADGNTTNTDNSKNNGNILLKRLESEEVICKLLDILLHEDKNNSSVSHVINVLIALLATRNPVPSNFHAMNHDDSNAHVKNSHVVFTILSRLGDLQKLLTSVDKGVMLPTSYGMEVERLGSLRLQVVTLLTSLVKTTYKQVHLKMAEISSLKVLLDMFFKFSLNNFLHAQVTQLIVSVLTMTEFVDTTVNNSCENHVSEDMDKQVADLEKACEQQVVELPAQAGTPFENPLLHELFTECQIIQTILSHYAKADGIVDTKAHNMKGYMGHLRDIANIIRLHHSVGPGQKAQYICKLIEELPKDVQTRWEEFCTVDLVEINLRNQIVPHQDFRDNDMDAVSEFRCAADVLSGIDDEMRKLGLGDPSRSVPEFDESEADYDLFAKLVAHNIEHGATKWSDKDNDNSYNADKEVNSSSDEDDTEFDNLRSFDEKMEEDNYKGVSEGGEEKRDMFSGLTDWSDCLNERNTLLNPGSFNPWQMATAEETSENSWANFESQKHDHFYPIVPPPAPADNDNTRDARQPPTTTPFEVNFEDAFKKNGLQQLVPSDSLPLQNNDSAQPMDTQTHDDKCDDSDQPMPACEPSGTSVTPDVVSHTKLT